MSLWKEGNYQSIEPPQKNFVRNVLAVDIFHWAD